MNPHEMTHQQTLERMGADASKSMVPAITPRRTARKNQMNKTDIIEALRKFISKRSGIDFRNYWDGNRVESMANFLSDYRPMMQDGRDARAMLKKIEATDGITATDLIEATSAFSGRLKFEKLKGKVVVDYTTGQYFPTEYRKAACAVLKRALMDYQN